ncbi:CAP domain-containing protein [uncultured Massilia sp.]|uniref:CAP domain-containing protein n=1 Tax=uncultured Massilia sp. TaxID=169973 RepID=UPI0025ED9476|nr:CAP domain-containing protein [uncultured Massilia sp.]
MAPLRILLPLLLLAATVPARADELADLINAWRAAPGTCAGAAALPAPPLAVEPALAGVRIGPGTLLEPALRRQGYRADRAESITVTGPQDARGAMDVLQKTYCGRLLAPAFTAVGTARRGREWQVVLAHPLVIPALPGWEEAGRQLLALVNATRASARRCGDGTFAAAAPLRWNAQLAQAALSHSGDMAERHYFEHRQPDGSEPADRATRAGYRWRLVGENIASGQRTPQEAMAAWLDSPGHCANIMNPRFAEMGAAYAINPDNDNRTAFWTQVFGAPR